MTPSPLLFIAFPSPKNKPNITELRSLLSGPIRFKALQRVWKDSLGLYKEEFKSKVQLKIFVTK